MALELHVRRDLDEELAGLDALETPSRGHHLGAGLWSAAWPKLLAVLFVCLIWQAVVWSGWRPDYLLPGPLTVAHTLGEQLVTASFWVAVATTLSHALEAYLIAVIVGGLVGLAVIRSRILRSAVGSLLTGLQSMPSIVWLPLAGILFVGVNPVPAIIFVVVLGAAPAVASGMVSGVDHVSPLLVRAGRVLGASGLTLITTVVLPAAMPEVVAGLKHGWALGWRSLMSAELIRVSAETIGGRLNLAQQNLEADLLIAMMIVVLAVGLGADSLFGLADKAVRRRWGLLVVE